MDGWMDGWMDGAELEGRKEGWGVSEHQGGLALGMDRQSANHRESSQSVTYVPCPKTTWRPSSQAVGTVVMKN